MKIVLVVLVVAAGTVLFPSSGGALHRQATACRATAVHYRTVEHAHLGIPGVPWVASSNSAFRGYLFYWGGTRWAHARLRSVRIFTTSAHVKLNPKVLWLALRGSGSTLTIRGTRLDGPGAFHARYPAASGGGQFPSYVSIPAAGCWRVEVGSGGVRGSVTFRATDAV